MEKQHTKEQINLIALWAFCESGLGGVLHAIKLPFTGFIVGGFACIILILLSEQFKHKPYQILKATLWVMAIKFAASPQAPFPAYIAVGFQGILAYLFLGLLPKNLFVCMAFASIALLESALQKFLLTTLIYGKSVWQALDIFAQNLLKDFNLSEDFSLSYWLIVIYSSIYFIWGLFLGYKGNFLPHRLYQLSKSLPRFEPKDEKIPTSRSNFKLKWIATVFTLVFIALTFGVLQGNVHKGIYVMLRTVAVLMVFMFVLNPLLRYFLRKFSKEFAQEHAFGLINEQVSEMAKQVDFIWQQSQIKSNIFSRVWYFMELMLAISLYPNEPK